MYAKVRFILILALGAYLCASCRKPTAILDLDPDIEEVAVYNALLESRFRGRYARSGFDHRSHPR